MHRLQPIWLIIFCCLAVSPVLLAQTAARQLDNLIVEKGYLQLERAVAAAKLSPDERDYFNGILADRKREPARAIGLLEKVLPGLKKQNRRRAAEALRSLGNDYFEAGRYADAADCYAALLHRYAGFFNKAQKQGFRDNLRTYNLLRGAPKQTVTLASNFSVVITRDPLGDIDVPLEVAGHKEQWIFDSGANITTIPLSTANRLGITLSKGTAETQGGATGTEVPLHIAIVPEIHFGSAVIRNAVALVMDDKALDIQLGNKQHYQITGILGYPVMSELGALTFSGSTLTVVPESTIASPARCTPIFVEELTPLLAAGVAGHELVFSFDSGASSGSLTTKYLHRFPQQFSSLEKIKGTGAGAGGIKFFDVYQLPELHLQLGSASATMHNITVNTTPLGSGLLDQLYGNLGQGLVSQFLSYTIDFAQMRLCVGEAN